MAWLDIFFGGICVMLSRVRLRLSILVSRVNPKLARGCDAIARSSRVAPGLRKNFPKGHGGRLNKRARIGF